MRKILLSAGVAAIAFSSNAQEAVEIGSEAFGEAVREYLLTNPGVIFEAVDIYNAQQEALAEQSAQTALSELMPALLDESTALILGNVDAEIAIVEFIDYNCGYCRKAHEAVEAILEKHQDVKVIIRHLPILSQGSLDAAKVAWIVQQKFGNESAVAFHNAVYKINGQIDLETALELASNLGHDRAQIESELESPAFFEQISLIHEAAGRLKIEGTPGFIIGDEIIRGYIPEEQMVEIIDSIRKK